MLSGRCLEILLHQKLFLLHLTPPLTQIMTDPLMMVSHLIILHQNEESGREEIFSLHIYMQQLLKFWQLQFNKIYKLLLKGITVRKKETKLLHYADDTTAVLSDIKSTLTLFKLLQDFKNYSGLATINHKDFLLASRSIIFKPLFSKSFIADKRVALSISFQKNLNINTNNFY